METSYLGFFPSGSSLGAPKPKGVLQGFLQLSDEERGERILPLLLSSSVPLSLRCPSLGRLLGQQSTLWPWEAVSTALRVTRHVHTGPWDQHTQKPLPVLAWTRAPAHTGSVATELELSSAGTTRFPSQRSTTFTFQTRWHLVYLEPVSEPSLGGKMVHPGDPCPCSWGDCCMWPMGAARRAPPVSCVWEGTTSKSLPWLCFSFLREWSRLRERRGTLSSLGTSEKQRLAFEGEMEGWLPRTWDDTQRYDLVPLPAVGSLTKYGQAYTLHRPRAQLKEPGKWGRSAQALCPSWLFPREPWRPVEKGRTTSPAAAVGQTLRSCPGLPQRPPPEIERGGCEGCAGSVCPSFLVLPKIPSSHPGSVLTGTWFRRWTVAKDGLVNP